MVTRLPNNDNSILDPITHLPTIQRAAQCGNDTLVRELLKNPEIDPSIDDNFAIRIASENGHYKVVENLLQDPRVNPSVNRNNAIITACRLGHEFASLTSLCSATSLRVPCVYL